MATADHTATLSIEAQTAAHQHRHLEVEDWNLEEGVHQIVLLKGETSWNPASTKRRIHGPALLVYRNWADGGIDVVEHDLPRPGVRLRYLGPEIPLRAGGMPVPEASEVVLITWYAGRDPNGDRLVEVEWPDLPRVTFYLRLEDIEVILEE